jgi:hypothetical protein
MRSLEVSPCPLAAVPISRPTTLPVASACNLAAVRSPRPTTLRGLPTGLLPAAWFHRIRD